MPKPETALIFGLEVLKDVRRDVVSVGAVGTTVPVYFTGGDRACAVHIYPHTEPVFMFVDRIDAGDYVTPAWLKGDMYHDYVFYLEPVSGSYPHFIGLLSPKDTTVSLNWAILSR